MTTVIVCLFIFHFTYVCYEEGRVTKFSHHAFKKGSNLFSC